MVIIIIQVSTQLKYITEKVIELLKTIFEIIIIILQYYFCGFIIL